MLNNKDIQFFRCFKHGKLPNRMFLECFIGLNGVTKESCCYGYPVTKEKQNDK